eukprot:353000-Chlamydomonas_euryale.AAC.21
MPRRTSTGGNRTATSDHLSASTRASREGHNVRCLLDHPTPPPHLPRSQGLGAGGPAVLSPERALVTPSAERMLDTLGPRAQGTHRKRALCRLRRLTQRACRHALAKRASIVPNSKSEENRARPQAVDLLQELAGGPWAISSQHDGCQEQPRHECGRSGRRWPGSRGYAVEVRFCAPAALCWSASPRCD